MKKVIMFSLLLALGGANINTANAWSIGGSVDDAIGYGKSYFVNTGTTALTRAKSSGQHALATFPAFWEVLKSVKARNLGQIKTNLKVWLVDNLGISVKDGTISLLATVAFLYGVGAMFFVLKQILGEESRPMTAAESRYLSLLLNGTFRFVNKSGYAALSGIWAAAQFVVGDAFPWITNTWRSFWNCPTCDTCDSTEQLKELQQCQASRQATQQCPSSAKPSADTAKALYEGCKAKLTGFFSISNYRAAFDKCMAEK